MPTSIPQLEKTGAPAAPLSYARMALAEAIEAWRLARDRMEAAYAPIAAVERMRVAAAEEKAMLEAEIRHLHEAYAAEMAEWLAAGSEGDRPALPRHAFEAARRLDEIDAETDSAARIAAVAEGAYRDAADAVQAATRERDAAACAAAVEAAEPLVDELRQAMTAALALDTRLKGLVLALRTYGARDPDGRAAVYSAASRLEGRLAEVLRTPRLLPDPAPSAAFIERLLSDAQAML